jgi:NAD+ synthase
LDAAPTDGLWDDQRNDEDQIGASYEELEKAMKWSKNNEWDQSRNDLNTIEGYLNLTEREKEVLMIFANHQKINAHKMSPVPVCKVPSLLRELI